MSLRPSRRLRAVERTLIRRIFDAAPPDAINLGLGEPDGTTPAGNGGSLEVARRLPERRRVITIPGDAFGSGGEGYLRLSFAARGADIVRGLKAVREELAG